MFNVKQKKATVVLAAITFFLSPLSYGAPEDALKSILPAVPTAAEKQYFSSLYKDTWNYLATFVEPNTGLPYDSSARQPVTSLSNIGFYLAAVTVAYQTDLISREEAFKRIERVLDSLDQVETWHGFPRPWMQVRTLKPSFGEEFSYGPHLSIYLGGLVVAKNALEEIAPRITHMLKAMKFRDLYDVQTGWLKGGYNMRTQQFALYQPWGHWYYKFFASETRLLSFYAVSRGAIPPEHWQKLIRPTMSGEGETFFMTGFEESGLDGQYVTGLFLDERDTEMGESQKSYARYQMKHAKAVGAPVWGWAAAESPTGRFLTYGDVRDDVVAPHASVLASIYFPKEAYQNLKKLEAKGARPMTDAGVMKRGYGFVDSINWKTGDVSKNYLTLSRGQVFLSLANLLHDQIVWKSFREDAAVQNGLSLLLKKRAALVPLPEERAVDALTSTISTPTDAPTPDPLVTPEVVS